MRLKTVLPFFQVLAIVSEVGVARGGGMGPRLALQLPAHFEFQ